MMISPGVFSHVFEIFIFQSVRGGGSEGDKGQKMAQDDKKLCLLDFISEEPYIICG